MRHILQDFAQTWIVGYDAIIPIIIPVGHTKIKVRDLTRSITIAEVLNEYLGITLSTKIINEPLHLRSSRKPVFAIGCFDLTAFF